MILVCDVDNVNVFLFFFDKRQSDMKKRKKERCVSFHWLGEQTGDDVLIQHADIWV